jgi:hypothetical protein
MQDRVTEKATNASLDPKRWQRTELRDDLPLFDPRLGHPDTTAPNVPPAPTRKATAR